MQLIDRKVFFAAITPIPLPRPRKQSQVNTIDAFIDEFERRGNTDLRQLAYMLATVLRETGSNMAPVREWFAKSDKEARAKARGKKYGKVVNGHVYYGRGLVQVTWDYNYKALTELAQQQGWVPAPDFVNNPDLLLDFKNAVWATYEGMTRGIFTKKKLGDYLNDDKDDWYNARRVVNGLDHAAEIGANAKAFYADLLTAQVRSDERLPLVSESQ